MKTDDGGGIHDGSAWGRVIQKEVVLLRHRSHDNSPRFDMLGSGLVKINSTPRPALKQAVYIA